MDPRPRRSKIEKVGLDSLRVPPAGKAQRPFRQAKGDEIAGNFDIDSFGFPVVCRVEDVNWLVDGSDDGKSRMLRIVRGVCANVNG